MVEKISPFLQHPHDFRVPYRTRHYGSIASDYTHRYNIYMRDAKTVLEATYVEMRQRALSLAADMDRLERAAGGLDLLNEDPGITKLMKALGVVADGKSERAARVQMIFSDVTPPPSREGKRTGGRNEKSRPS